MNFTLTEIFSSKLQNHSSPSNLDNFNSSIIDVGGQRGERERWIRCFEGITSVIFLTAISEFGQVLTENVSKNRLQESIDLFGTLINSQYLTKSSFILFLNKTDVFKERIQKSNLKDFFSEYQGLYLVIILKKSLKFS